MDYILGVLKRLGDALLALGLLLGVLSAIILTFGGNIPPWFTVTDAQNQQRVIQGQILQQQVHQERSDRVLGSIALTVYNSQLIQAQTQMDAAAKLGKRDLAAEALKENALQAIMSITSLAAPLPAVPAR